MLNSTCTPYLPLILDWLLPPVAALLSAIALWVGHRARSTSTAALSTSLDHEKLFSPLLGRRTRSASRLVAQGRKK